MILTRTPLRISFAGGGTDLKAFYKDEPGAVISTTINKYIYITANRHWDKNRVRVAYSTTENVMCADELQHELVRQALLLSGIHSGIEIASVSDIPAQGSGLGSSSAYTVGVLNALGVYKGSAYPKKNLAQMACRIEIDNLGKPIGKQDQYACAFGGLRLIEFLPDETVSFHPVNLTTSKRMELESRLMLFYTALARSSDGILAKQSENTRKDKKTRENLRAMAQIARNMKDALDNGNLDAFGFAMSEGWERKKKLADGISNDLIDVIYDKAIKAGALGGKLLGAGGGGFLLFYAKQEYHEAIKEAVKMRHVPFKLDEYGTFVMYSRTE